MPGWPPRTVAVLSTVGEDVHAIPISAPVRAGDSAILLSLHRSRDTLERIRRWPEVALTFLAEGDVAFTARGRATVVEEPMAVDPEYAAVSIAVDHVDDHRQPAFRVTAGVDREWADEAARAALAARVQALSTRQSSAQKRRQGVHREDQQHFRPDLPGQGSRPDRRVL
jgi:hypothetical protein